MKHFQYKKYLTNALQINGMIVFQVYLFLGIMVILTTIMRTLVH